jgi:hypothetical protein
MNLEQENQAVNPKLSITNTGKIAGNQGIRNGNLYTVHP